MQHFYKCSRWNRGSVIICTRTWHGSDTKTVHVQVGLQCTEKPTQQFCSEPSGAWNKNLLLQGELQLLNLPLHRCVQVALLHWVLHEEGLQDERYKDAKRQNVTSPAGNSTVAWHDKIMKKLHFSYFIMMMTTMMWKRTKKILADTWLTEVKPLLSSGTTIRNNSLHASCPSRPRPPILEWWWLVIGGTRPTRSVCWHGSNRFSHSSFQPLWGYLFLDQTWAGSEWTCAMVQQLWTSHDALGFCLPDQCRQSNTTPCWLPWLTNLRRNQQHQQNLHLPEGHRADEGYRAIGWPPWAPPAGWKMTEYRWNCSCSSWAEQRRFHWGEYSHRTTVLDHQILHQRTWSFL